LLRFPGLHQDRQPFEGVGNLSLGHLALRLSISDYPGERAISGSVAAWAGLAPDARESGDQEGPRPVRGDGSGCGGMDIWRRCAAIRCGRLFI